MHITKAIKIHFNLLKFKFCKYMYTYILTNLSFISFGKKNNSRMATHSPFTCDVTGLNLNHNIKRGKLKWSLTNNKPMDKFKNGSYQLSLTGFKEYSWH